MKIIDFHCDTIYRMMELKMQGKKVPELFKNDFHVDLVKMRQGQVAAQFFALFMDQEELKREGIELFSHFLEMVELFNDEIDKNPTVMKKATGYQDLESNLNDNILSGFLGIEGGEALEGSYENLDRVYQEGVRLITLTWNYENELGYPSKDPMDRDKPLKAFGKETVKRMEEMGIMIDLSHLSDGGFWDVMQLTKTPVIVSHSNCRALKNHHRNLTDQMIRAIGEKGGVIGVNFAPYFLSGNEEVSRIDDLLRHMEHMIRCGGEDVVALGSDFDGITGSLEIKDAGTYQKLIEKMEVRGYHYDRIEKIAFKNAKRVIKEVL